MDLPIFGEKQPNCQYKGRYGAYVVVPQKDHKKMILVQAPNGAYFLPGGGIEAGETHLEAIHREMLEELGFEVTIGSYFGEAVEYFYSRHRKTHYYHPGYFYEVTDWKSVAAPTETTNQLVWVTPIEAKKLLKRGSHRWAVEQWLQKHPPCR
ncbi:NUDIX hydrolase [Enterococcus sp. LJL98]